MMGYRDAPLSWKPTLRTTWHLSVYYFIAQPAEPPPLSRVWHLCLCGYWLCRVVSPCDGLLVEGPLCHLNNGRCSAYILAHKWRAVGQERFLSLRLFPPHWSESTAERKWDLLRNMWRKGNARRFMVRVKDSLACVALVQVNAFTHIV